MALSSTEEAQTRALIAQNAALLSLAASEPTIISKLSATKVSLADLTPAVSLSDTDLFLVRQGTVEKSVAKSLISQVIPDASETVKGIVELATIAEAQAGIDTVRAVTPAGLGSVGKQLQSIDYTLVANALTLKLNPTTLAFRSTTLTSGAPTLVSNAAQITTTISSGSTGGTISGISSDIVFLAINNAGSIELAWTNLEGGVNLDETTLINTTAEGGAGSADSATVIYSTTARTGVAFRVVGVFRSTHTTAGTWAQTPALVQPLGGQALNAMSSIGYGQAWQDVTGSRASGTTYYNTTGRPITALAYSNTGGSSITAIVGGVTLPVQSIYSQGIGQSILIPPGKSYSITVSAGYASWFELR